jgi:hypothetical protein
VIPHFIAPKRREKLMKKNLEKVKLLSRDLREGKQFPRSPRETLGAT